MLAPKRGRTLPLIVTLGAAVCLARPAAAQTFPAYVLRDLPSGGNVFAVAESTIPEVVADRFNSGGLNPGLPARLSGLFGSWSQTRYRIGRIDVSSPVDGTPLIFPRVLMWDRVEFAEIMTPLSYGAPGLVVSMTPVFPSARGAGVVEAFVSGGPLTAARAGTPPATAQLESTRGIGMLAGGAVTDRMRLSLGGSWSRTEMQPRRSHVTSASAYGQATATMTDRDTLTAIAIVDSTAEQGAFHLQGTWTRRSDAGRDWLVSAAYTVAERSSSRPSAEIVDRLADGPIPVRVADRARTERLWSLGVEMQPPPDSARHSFRAGVNLDVGAVRESGIDGREIRETLDGIPARIWSYAPLGQSRRSSEAASAFFEYRLRPTAQTSLSTGVRYEYVRGAADESVHRISWQSLLPAAQLTWHLGTPLNLTFTTGARQTANRLLLGLLTVGDPASPAADVYRWDAASGRRGPLVARVGPGANGDAAFSVIDVNLPRPRVDEFAIGLTARPRPTLVVGVQGVARRQTNIPRLVNVGVSPDDYRVFTVRDDNVDLVLPDDDQDLPVFERLSESFGHDRYFLASAPDDTASMGAVIVRAEVTTPRLYMFIGGTASAAVGSGGSRGFRADENDQDVLGELSVNPNAATHARGRLFSDRAYTVKWSTVYRFPGDIRLGVIARYQDGQPFSRVVIVPGLNQGPEVVQAFPRGRSRFAFTGTLDVRLQKSITLAGTRVDAILDVYNLPGMSKETEEYVVTGARFRETSATQPPRSLHLGLRVRF